MILSNGRKDTSTIELTIKPLLTGTSYRKSVGNTAGKNILKSVELPGFESDLLQTNEHIAFRRVTKFYKRFNVVGKFVSPTIQKKRL